MILNFVITCHYVIQISISLRLTSVKLWESTHMLKVFSASKKHFDFGERFYYLKKLFNCMRLMHFSYTFSFNWLIGNKYIANGYNKSVVYLLGNVYFRLKVNAQLNVFL